MEWMNVWIVSDYDETGLQENHDNTYQHKSTAKYRVKSYENGIWSYLQVIVVNLSLV